ncbi:MAG: DSD1 family PLP-dependent enzyme [Alphaproteobacteria bacterium]|nr:DSD1 family PLP-dependent enzyme [Alphaproteobacteria bacterium]
MAPLNADLIGLAGGAAELATPALVVDLDALERNIAAMAAHARRCGLALRPHAKTHKSVEIARRQIAAGALGVCCAKLGEAEALAEGGIGAILVTSPVVTGRGMARLVALNARIADLMAVCDDIAVAARFDAAAQAAGKPLRILIDIDPGMGRTGVSVAEAPALVRSVARAAGLVYAGLQCYAGHLQHIESSGERRNASLAALKDLAALRDRLAADGIAPSILSGGGTGTFDIDPDAGALTELQVGSYVFMDRQYNDVWAGRPPFETALYVQTTVISANRAGLATTDAGFKAFATDAGAPAVASGAPQGAAYFFFGDEQGGVAYDESARKLAPGDVLRCIVPHCDPTVNLYDAMHAVRAETLVEIWPIEGRGRSA